MVDHEVSAISQEVLVTKTQVVLAVSSVAICFSY